MTKEQLAKGSTTVLFFKRKRDRLGLMVTFSILQAHNGTLEYKSESGKGTEAVIILSCCKK
ncbi:hypothetical protein ACT7DP_12720 [Bacillus paranthracis]